MTHQVGDVWYRYEDKSYSVTLDAEQEIYGSEFKVERRTYRVVKVTPKGVQLEMCNDDGTPFGFRTQTRFQLNDSVKRFACPTDTLAKESFIARKERQAGIYQARADLARRAIAIVQKKSEFCL